MTKEKAGEKAWNIDGMPANPYDVRHTDAYQVLAMTTKSPLSNGIDWLTEAILGLTSEAGEIADDLRKHLFQGHELDLEHMKNDLGDVAWYLAAAADAIGVKLSDVFDANIEKLAKRYPNGFETARSIHGEDRRLRITYYNTDKFEKTTSVIAVKIDSASAPDDMTDDERRFRRCGGTSACQFQTMDGKWHSVLWKYVISIVPVGEDGIAATTEKPPADVPLESAFLDRMARAIKEYRERDYGRGLTNNERQEILDSLDDPERVVIDNKVEVPAEKFTEEQLIALSVPKELWNDMFPLIGYINLRTLEIVTELNSIVVEREQYMSQDKLLEAIQLADAGDFVQCTASDDLVAAIYGFTQDQPMENINDSMELDSDTFIAELCCRGYCARIDVSGDVRVTYKEEETYRKASKMPEELLELIHDGKYGDDDDVYVGNNNWFSLEFGKRNEEDTGYDMDPDDDVIDGSVEGKTPTEIFEYLLNRIEKYIARVNAQ